MIAVNEIVVYIDDLFHFDIVRHYKAVQNYGIVDPFFVRYIRTAASGSILRRHKLIACHKIVAAERIYPLGTELLRLEHTVAVRDIVIEISAYDHLISVLLFVGM